MSTKAAREAFYEWTRAFTTESMLVVGGYRVIASPLMPRFRWTGPVVWTGAYCSDGALEAFNDWAAALFGGRKETAIFVSEENRTMFVHPDVVERLRETDGTYQAPARSSNPDLARHE
jgi:hypothetical protein